MEDKIFFATSDLETFPRLGSLCRTVDSGVGVSDLGNKSLVQRILL